MVYVPPNVFGACGPEACVRMLLLSSSALLSISGVVLGFCIVLVQIYIGDVGIHVVQP